MVVGIVGRWQNRSEVGLKEVGPLQRRREDKEERRARTDTKRQGYSALAGKECAGRKGTQVTLARERRERKQTARAGTQEETRREEGRKRRLN